MSKPDAVRLREDGMALLGRTIAVHSHDVINAFNVISEMAGLQLDLLQEAAGGEPVDLVELEKICRQIRSYARSGDATVRSLNWVAHRFDDVNPEVEVGQTLAKAVTAAGHLLSVRRVSIALEAPDEQAFARVDPFLLAYAILLGLETLTFKSPRDKTVTVGWQPVPQGIEIAIESGEPVEPPLDREAVRARFELLLRELGGAIETLEGDARGERLVLTIPASRTPAGGVSETGKEVR